MKTITVILADGTVMIFRGNCIVNENYIEIIQDNDINNIFSLNNVLRITISNKDSLSSK